MANTSKALVAALAFVTLLSLAQAGTFVHISVTSPSSVAGQYGCMPASYSGPRPTQTSLEVVLPQPASGCSRLRNAAQVRGKVVLAQPGGCSFHQKAVLAQLAGAAAMVTYDTVGSAPGMAAPAFRRFLNLPMAACTLWPADGASLVKTVLSSLEPVKVGFSGFTDYVEEDAPSIRHPVTSLDVVSPSDLKWRFPASQATFNPTTFPVVTARIVEAVLHPECQSQMPSRCTQCWALPNAFSNAAQLLGNIAYFSMRSTETGDSPDRDHEMCFPYYYSLLYELQRSGAKAVVVPMWRGLATIGPYIVPFDVQIPMFAMMEEMASLFHEAFDDGVPVIASTPPISGLSGPSYFLPDDDDGTLPDTQLSFTHDGTRMTFPAGQAAFNPYTKQAVLGAEVKLAVVAPECAEAPGSGPHGMSGVDCTTCHAKAEAGVALTGVYTDTAVLVFAQQVFCFSHWLDVARMVQTAGASSMLVGNAEDMTWYLRSDEPGTMLQMPTFNLAKANADMLHTDLTVQTFAPTSLTVDVPAIINGSAPTASVATQDLPATQVHIVDPPTLRGSYEAGQALFNPVSAEVRATIVQGELNGNCDGSAPCLYCELMDSQLSSDVDVAGAIVAIKLSELGCMKPIANFVLAVQQKGAVGVLVAEESEHLTAVGPANLGGVNITIPTFVILPSLMETIFASTEPVTMRLPFVERTGAPGSINNDPVVAPTGSSSGSSPSGMPATDDDDSTPQVQQPPPSGFPWYYIVGAAGALFVGVVATVVVLRWRRNRRAMLYHKVTTGQQTDAFGGPAVELNGIGPQADAPLLQDDGAAHSMGVGTSMYDADDRAGSGIGVGVGTQAGPGNRLPPIAAVSNFGDEQPVVVGMALQAPWSVEKSTVQQSAALNTVDTDARFHSVHTADGSELTGLPRPQVLYQPPPAAADAAVGPTAAVVPSGETDDPQSDGKALLGKVQGQDDAGSDDGSPTGNPGQQADYDSEEDDDDDDDDDHDEDEYRRTQRSMLRSNPDPSLNSLLGPGH